MSEKKVTLFDYEDEIFAIGRANNNATVDISSMMFLNNVQDAGMANDPYFYHGADQVNYRALQPHLKDLKDSRVEFLAKFPKGRRV